MTPSTLYYNANCSKCRAALALLQERGVEPTLVAYLEQPPTLAALTVLLKQLGFADARQLMRPGEAEYAALGLDDPGLSQEALLEALAKHPRLIERPVFVNQGRAVIGRPPEKVLDIL
ncbi:MAG: arsenate reductase (glutaredoxin) [Sulfuritalea sp.]|nr:arsenate reductase (glutaredoxin) [Sulfuritalea sp.]